MWRGFKSPGVRSNLSFCLHSEPMANSFYVNHNGEISWKQKSCRDNVIKPSFVSMHAFLVDVYSKIYICIYVNMSPLWKGLEGSFFLKSLENSFLFSATLFKPQRRYEDLRANLVNFGKYP